MINGTGDCSGSLPSHTGLSEAEQNASMDKLPVSPAASKDADEIRVLGC